MTDFLPIVLGLIALCCFFLGIRELLLLVRLPSHHPERGLYWFNSFFLLLASLTLLFGGHYLEERKQGLEGLIAPYPHSRYAIEQNSLFPQDSWVYTTNKKTEEIKAFYRTYSAEHAIMILESAGSGVAHMSFRLPSGDLFLTIQEHEDGSTLYFTRNGDASVVSE